LQEIGRVRELVRYPVKSMAGTVVKSAAAGWHGLAGDRRLAFRRIGEANSFPWLSASRLPELLAYRPTGLDESNGEPIPTHVQTPAGSQLQIGSAELDDHVSRQFGKSVELTHLKHGIFDEAPVSVINLATIDGISREADLDLDRRRFRANVYLESARTDPFQEDEWVGGTLIFGDGESRVVLSVTMQDYRCAMINLDPETCERNPHVMKTVIRLNEGYAGVYATVIRTGTINVGDRVRFAAEESS